MNRAPAGSTSATPIGTLMEAGSKDTGQKK
jgi:hypothetical protein